MRHEYLAVEADATVESAKQLIHGAWDQARLFGHLYVVDGEQRLLGSVSLKSLLIADPLLPVGELMEGRRCASTPGRIGELAARLLIDRDLSPLPVEDQGSSGGVFHVDDAADILELESTEDAELQGAPRRWIPPICRPPLAAVAQAGGLAADPVRGGSLHRHRAAGL